MFASGNSLNKSVTFFFLHEESIIFGWQPICWGWRRVAGEFSCKCKFRQTQTETKANTSNSVSHVSYAIVGDPVANIADEYYPWLRYVRKNAMHKLKMHADIISNSEKTNHCVLKFFLQTSTENRLFSDGYSRCRISDSIEKFAY